MGFSIGAPASSEIIKNLKKLFFKIFPASTCLWKYAERIYERLSRGNKKMNRGKMKTFFPFMSV
jgi:hypothetical protein